MEKACKHPGMKSACKETPGKPVKCILTFLLYLRMILSSSVWRHNWLDAQEAPNIAAS